MANLIDIRKCQWWKIPYLHMILFFLFSPPFFQLKLPDQLIKPIVGAWNYERYRYWQFCCWPFWDGENVTVLSGESWPRTRRSKGHVLNHLVGYVCVFFSFFLENTPWKTRKHLETTQFLGCSRRSFPGVFLYVFVAFLRFLPSSPGLPVASKLES